MGIPQARRLGALRVVVKVYTDFSYFDSFSPTKFSVAYLLELGSQ
jgi:hypothetical protein